MQALSLTVPVVGELNLKLIRVQLIDFLKAGTHARALEAWWVYCAKVQPGLPQNLFIQILSITRTMASL